MTHLTADQLSELKSELERQLEKVEKSMAVSKEALKPVELDQSAVGRLSRIDSLQNQSMTKNLYQREQTTLAQIQSALLRVDAGSYGICTVCDSEIEFGRLYVFPEAEACQGCG